eukprot:CAMPEP_0202685280 /NCGR_PEP_ID=MMETSP1385-20130828/1036_1 /ASSEMBLY_ACC=CAM_ASM_000861 /TAXON_ID=933848 /ORGANISM="Elphidium margaritaceum" /LENGTH=347 /DNA_ID=CAMNT_0049339593 /DNA_START=60 /DNA_END=1103 /DNA_ORIENTATION=+
MATEDQVDDALCEQNREVMEAYNYFLGAVAVIATIFIGTVMVSLVKSRLNAPPSPDARVAKIIFWTAFVFLLSEFMWSVSSAVIHFLTCPSEDHVAIYNAAYVGVSLFWLLDYFLIIVLFYVRIYFVFRGSPLAISKKGNAFFWFCYVCIIVLGLVAATVPPLLVLAFSLYLILVICCLVYLSGRLPLSLYKMLLKQGGEDEELKRIVTKVSMLSAISLTMSLVSFFVIALGIAIPTMPVRLANSTFAFVDKMTNVVAVAFCQDAFKNVYGRTCGPCDRAWTLLCGRCSGGKISTNMADVVNSSSNPTETPRVASGTAACVSSSAASISSDDITQEATLQTTETSNV